MTDLVPAFVQSIRRSRLLRPAELNELKAGMMQDAREPRALAAKLVARGWLTPFEADLLLEGHDHDLNLRPYRLLELVGEGGLCQVFKAWNSSTKSVVALKIVHPELRSNRQVLDQLQQELQVLARLAHPCYVKVYDVKADSMRPYFAMEYVEGIDLSKLLQQAGTLPMEQACAYIRQVASGLQYAYEQGLVHRDIKPANLLVPFQGNQVRILDIGIARLEWSRKDPSASAAPVRTGAVMGTPDYIAPEQARNSLEADIRADIYSLGCTLYHLLTGQPPFPGKSLSKKLMQHQQEPPPSIRRQRPELPEELEAVLQRMMAKAPEDRYQTPAGVRVALTRFSGDGGPRLSLDRFRPQPCGNNGILDRPLPGSPAKLADQTRSGSEAVTRTLATHESASGRLVLPAPGRPGFKERREAARRIGSPVSVVVMAPTVRPEPISGWVINRSSSGLGLLLDEDLEVGTVVDVQPARCSSGPFGVSVRVIRCATERGSWRIGCKFVEKHSHEKLRMFG
jgi:serine/threonine protein kinase